MPDKGHLHRFLSDRQQDAAFPAGGCEPRQVQTMSDRIVDGTDRKKACLRRQRLDQRGLGIRGRQGVDGPVPHTPGLQRLPDHAVGDEIVRDADHLVAVLPVQARCDGGQPLGGILGQRDVVGVGGIDESCQTLPQSTLYGEPSGVIATATQHILLRKGRDDLGRAPRPWPDRGVVEIGESLVQRELGRKIEHARQTCYSD